MMAAKAKLFGDQDALTKIFDAPDPRTAKAIGKTVRNFDNTIWNANATSLVIEGNVHKFTQNRELGDFLRSTGDSVLVEASPLDPIWGIGLDESDPKARDPIQWQGKNLLGFALMEVRTKLT